MGNHNEIAASVSSRDSLAGLCDDLAVTTKKIDEILPILYRMAGGLRIVRSELRDAQARLFFVKMGVLRMGGIRNARSWADKVGVWRLGLVLSVPPVVGVTVFIFTDLLLRSLWLSGTVAFISGVWLLVDMRSRLLGLSADEAEARRRVAIVSEESLSSIVAGIKDRERTIASEYDRIRGEVEYQRGVEKQLRSCIQGERRRLAKLESRLVSQRGVEQRMSRLVSQKWREMRGVEFEKFLASVFRELGYEVHETKLSGDQGVDLLVCYRRQILAIQVKGYHGSVGNYAVQEVYAGMAFHKCTRCVVITNSRFTTAAVELANQVGCILVDSDSLSEMILGRLNLFSNSESSTV